MLANLAQKLQDFYPHRPLAVVKQQRRLVARAKTIKTEEGTQLRGHRRHVGPQFLPIEQVALVGPEARIANHAGGSASQGHRSMTGVLKAPEGQKGNQVTNVEAVGRGIESAIEGYRAGVEALPQRTQVGAVLD